VIPGLRSLQFGEGIQSSSGSTTAVALMISSFFDSNAAPQTQLMVTPDGRIGKAGWGLLPA
jgi:hypothetical protein